MQAFQHNSHLLKLKRLKQPLQIQAVTLFSASNTSNQNNIGINILKRKEIEMTKANQAKENFMSGLNCSKAVAAAFAEEMKCMPKSAC